MSSTNKTISGCGFHHVAIKVFDFEKAVQFYVEVLGFRKKIAWASGGGKGKAIMLDTGDGNYVEIFDGGPKEPAADGPIIHFAFRADDCDAALERARAAGAVVTMEPANLDIPSDPPTPVRIAFCKGFGGEVIEFFQNELT